VVIQGLIITLHPLAAGVELFRAIEHSDGPVAGLQEELHGLDRPCLDVAGDIVNIGQIGYAIEEYDGDTVALQHIEMFVIGGVLGNGDDEPVDAVAHDILDDMFFPGFDIMGLAKQYGVLLFAGSVFDGADRGRKVKFGEIGKDDADREGLTLLEEDGFLVGLIVQFPGQLLDPYPGKHAYSLMIMEGPGYGRCRDIEFFGNFLDGGWIDHNGFFKRQLINIIHITSFV